MKWIDFWRVVGGPKDLVERVSLLLLFTNEGVHIFEKVESQVSKGKSDEPVESGIHCRRRLDG